MGRSTRRDDVVRQVAPPVARNLVVRTRLLDQLDRTVAAVPVVLVCAPAGYGKSLLVASWFADRAGPCRAWVDVARARRSSEQLWSAIVQAVASTLGHPDHELDALAAVAKTAPEDIPARLGAWLSAQPDHTYLVIDELHELHDLTLHEQLVELVAAAPERLHLIAITRHDPPWPLHRLRADGLVDHIRADKLAFDAAEAGQLFEHLDVSLRPAQAEELVARTQGWAAALRLAALGASQAAAPDAYVDAVSGRDEYIADYLWREVYETLDPDWRAFLATIAVVDEVSAELAEALSGEADSDLRLAELARQNLFIAEFGQRAGWYQLHPLLLDFLRSRVTDRCQRRLLHARAARWFRAQGEPGTALRHALAGEDWELAEDLTGTYVVSWTVRRPPADFLAELAVVPREVILSRPGLAIARAAALSMLARPDDLPELVDAARSHLDGVDEELRRRYELVIDLVDLGHVRFGGDLERVLDRTRQIPTDPVLLGELGLADWWALRTLVINNRGTAELWTGDLGAAREHLGEAARVDAFHLLDLPTLNAQAHLAYLNWLVGELNDAETIARGAIDGAGRLGVPQAMQVRCAYLALAGVAFDRDELDGAVRWLEVAGTATGEPQTEFAGHLLAAKIQGARGQVFEAVADVRELRKQAMDRPLPGYLVAQSYVSEAQLLSSSGNAAGAREVMDALDWPMTEVAPDRASVRARVDRHLARVRQAISAGRRDAALAQLDAALAVAAPQRLRRPFLDRKALVEPLLGTRLELGTSNPEFAADLLDRLAGESTSSHSGDSIFVPLTARETNILRYLATTLTTKEIAGALYVSVNTVKTHQRSIHQKLGASDRREAVAHARALGLL